MFDEAQKVSSGLSGVAAMAGRLQGTHRWAVTGGLCICCPDWTGLDLILADCLLKPCSPRLHRGLGYCRRLAASICSWPPHH